MVMEVVDLIPKTWWDLLENAIEEGQVVSC